jgi:hypothetical protein
MELAAMLALNVNRSSLELTCSAEIKETAAIGELTVVISCAWTAARSPVTVTISLEPAAIAITGCRAIVTATPVSDAKCFDRVVCERMSAQANEI